MHLAAVQYNTVKITGEVVTERNAARYVQCSAQFSGQRAQLALLLSNSLPLFPIPANRRLRL